MTVKNFCCSKLDKFTSETSFLKGDIGFVLKGHKFELRGEPEDVLELLLEHIKGGRIIINEVMSFNPLIFELVWLKGKPSKDFVKLQKVCNRYADLIAFS